MISLLAVLLYLQLVTSGATYTDHYIDDLSSANQAKISNIQSDAALSQQVHITYDQPASTIVILPEVTE